MNQLFLQAGSVGEISTDAASTVKDWISYLGLDDAASSIIGGLFVLIFGFFIAKSVAKLISNLFKKMGIDNKLKGNMSISGFVGKLVYFFLMLIVLMTALNIMGVGDQVLEPLNSMVKKFTDAIPNILIAGIIAYIGYFLAKLVSEFVEFSGDTIRSLVPKLKLPESIDLVKIIKNIVFIFVFIPILIVALDFLNFDAITVPATSMLSQFLNAIPLIIKAVAIIVIAIFGGRLLTNLFNELLLNLKVDSLSEKLGLSQLAGNSNFSLSKVVSNLAYFFIVFSGVIEALNVLGLSNISDVLIQVLYVTAKITFGVFILIIGNVVANFAVNLISQGKNTNQFTLAIMKGAILIIFLAMGLNSMDIADDIINLAFGLALGAVAVAFALSFGLGGREAAGKEMQKFFDKLNNKDNN